MYNETWRYFTVCGNEAAVEPGRDYITRTEEETRALGERLSALLHPGDVVIISGELGTGKTRLVQGIARGLGVSGPVTSPTFSLVKEYYGRLPLYHADLYRLAPRDLPALGLEEYLQDGGVLCIEWGERAAGLYERWSDDALLIDLGWLDEERRRVRVRGMGPGWIRRAAGLAGAGV
jgi:tRNA threonylcarbamoyladenosine biosynthesis protein TsaE